MRFFVSVAYFCAFVVASPFLLEVVAAKESLKGKNRGVRLSTKEHAQSKTKKRRLSGKGKGKGSPDDDFYRFPCEFCGQGNDSALGGELCFSKDMTVQVLGRGGIAMKDLKVGDKVMTRDGLYQPVYSFGHHDPTKEASFLQIYTDSDQPLELTHDHLVFLANKKNPVKAKSVRVGDILQSAHDNAVISKVQTVEKTGIYAPLTWGGTLMVNGVLASSYISLQDMTASDGTLQESSLSNEYLVLQGSKVQLPIMSHHQYVDMAIAPFRLTCRIVGNALCDATTNNGDGMPLYVKMGIAFNRGTRPDLNVHPWVVLATVLATAPFWFVERTFFLANGSLNVTLLAVVATMTALMVGVKKRVAVVARKVKTA